MPPLSQNYLNLLSHLTKVTLSLALIYTSSYCAFAGNVQGFHIDGTDINYSVTDTELNIGAGFSNQPSIYFDSSNSLNITFVNSPGTVNINQSNWSENAVISVQDTAINLVIQNGSLNIDFDDGIPYASNGVITMSWGGALMIDRDLVIDYEVTRSPDLSQFPYSAILSESSDITVKGNTNISISRANWENAQYGMSFVGLLQASVNSKKDHIWNFGTNSDNTLEIHDMNAGTTQGSASSYGILIQSPENTTNIYASANIHDVHAFTKSDDVDNYAYAIGAEVQEGILNFLGDVRIYNISAQVDSSLSGDPVSSFASGASGQNAEAYALGAFANGRININLSESDQTIVQIENNMIVTDGGAINANFTNANSHFIGTTKNYVDVQPGATAGEMNLSFKNGAYWRVTESNSQAVVLTLENSNLYLNQNSSGEDSTLTRDNAINLKLSELAGNNGLFFMRTSLEEAYGDSVSIKKATGQHKLMLSSSGTNPTKAATDRALVTQNEGDATFSLANANGVIDLGNYVYSLNSRTGSDGSTQWYLATDSVNPDVEQLSPSANAVLALAGSGSQTTQFLYSLSDLRKRMGDVRHGVSEGLYASLRGGKDRIAGFASTSFKNEYAALSLGYDKKVNNNWMLGLSFEAIEGDQTVKGGGYKAEGEDSTQSIKAYATWFNGIGCYADFVIGINRFDQDISTHMLDGRKVKGNYSSYGFGVSTEVGKRFTLGADETWFIEPQAQLSYFQVHGKDFRLNNGMSVEQENADSLTGRLGVVVGRTLLDDSGEGVQFSARAGFNHEFLGDANIYVNKERFTDDSLGSRGYYGLGVDWYASDSVKVYGYIEREEGSHYTSEFNARVGVKYHF